MVRFSAIVQVRGPNPFLDVPVLARNELLPFAEHGRIRVTGLLRGAEFNATLIPVKPGRHILYVPGGLRAATGVNVGDIVTVDVQPIRAHQVIPLPAIWPPPFPMPPGPRTNGTFCPHRTGGS